MSVRLLTSTAAAAAAATITAILPVLICSPAWCSSGTELRLPRETDAVVVVDGFLPDDLFQEARATLLRLADDAAAGHFQRAEQMEAIRSDDILWLPTAPPPSTSPSSPSPSSSSSSNALAAVIAALTSLASRVEAPDGDDGQPVRLTAPSYIQAAVYRVSGAHYTTHRDNKRPSRLNVDDDALWLRSREQRYRHVTCVLYLTPPHWDTHAHGGALRCYRGCASDDDDGRTARTVMDVAPTANRLVIFRSCDVPHAVLPLTDKAAGGPRIALTIWLLQEDE